MANSEQDRLSIESSMALAAGMSYGKWKALQKFTNTTQSTKREFWVRRICEYCGKEFVQYDRRVRKYCNAVCQITKNQERMIERRAKK